MKLIIIEIIIEILNMNIFRIVDFYNFRIRMLILIYKSYPSYFFYDFYGRKPISSPTFIGAVADHFSQDKLFLFEDIIVRLERFNIGYIKEFSIHKGILTVRVFSLSNKVTGVGIGKILLIEFIKLMTKNYNILKVEFHIRHSKKHIYHDQFFQKIGASKRICVSGKLIWYFDSQSQLGKELKSFRN